MSRPSSTSRALQLPEILHAIALSIPLFEHDSLLRPSSYSYSPFSCFERYYVYTLRHLLPCTLVSRLWNSCFTPHLYHYYIENYETPLLLLNTRCIKAFQKNHRHSRRYRVFNPDRRYFSDVRFPETEFLPRELVGLFLYTISESTAKLLLCNQGPQLRQLVWSGNRFGCKMEKIYEDALTNLPCLEQLELNEWHVTNELMYRMLQNCSRTLKELKLKAIAGFDEKLFYEDINAICSLDNNCFVAKVPGPSSWTLPRLKSLKLVLDDMQSQASVLLPQVCPALESIRIKVKSKGHPVQQLIATLHEHCPHLHTIHYQRDLKDEGS